MKKIGFFVVLCLISIVFWFPLMSSGGVDLGWLVRSYKIHLLARKEALSHDECVGISDSYCTRIANASLYVCIELPIEICFFDIRLYGEQYLVTFAHPAYFAHDELLAGSVGTISMYTESKKNRWQIIAKIMKDPEYRSSVTTRSPYVCGRKNRYVIMPCSGHEGTYKTLTSESFKAVFQHALATKQAQIFFTVYSWRPFVLECGETSLVCPCASFWLTHPLLVRREKVWRNRMKSSWWSYKEEDITSKFMGYASYLAYF